MRKARRIQCHLKKFMVDGKVLWVHAASRIPLSIQGMTALCGIELQDAKKEERIKYLEYEKKARDRRTRG